MLHLIHHYILYNIKVKKSFFFLKIILNFLNYLIIWGILTFKKMFLSRILIIKLGFWGYKEVKKPLKEYAENLDNEIILNFYLIF